MSGLFGGGGKAQSQSVTRYNAVQLQQSTYGAAMPLVYGTNRLPGNLQWYGNFISTPHSQNSGGKGGHGGGGSTSYTYTAAMAIGICEGPIAGIGTIWVDKALHTVSDLGLTAFLGAGGQSPWSYLTTNFPAQAIGYDHTAYVANPAMDLGSSAGMPNYSFEIQGLYRDVSINGDAEPSNVVTDYCTDANHGVGFNYLAPLTGTNSFQQYCKALGLTISPVESNQRAAADFLKDVLRITNSEAVWSSSGVLKLIPRGDASVSGNGASWTPSNGAGGAISTPIYTIADSGFVASPDMDPVILETTVAADLFNVVRVQYLDRANQYNVAPAEAKDDGDIATNGERVAPTLKLDAVTQLSVARQVAQFELNKVLYYADQLQFQCLPDYQLLEPMDVIATTDPVTGANALCRVVSYQEGDDTSDVVTLVVELLPIGPGSPPQYSAQAGIGYTPNQNQAPGSVQVPVIFAGPPQLCSNVGGYELWIAVCGPSGSTVWGGCNVWMSLDGGTTYKQVGTITSQGKYGPLSASYASGSDPDTSNALSVTLANTALSLTAGSASDADNMRTLALLLDSGGATGELISFEYCVQTSAGNYTFTSTGLTGGTKYNRRGQYGSAIGAHSTSATFVRLDDGIFRMPIDSGMSGQTATFKFQSFNIWSGGVESLAGLTAYSHVIPTIIGGIDHANNGNLNLPIVTDNLIRNGDFAQPNGYNWTQGVGTFLSGVSGLPKGSGEFKSNTVATQALFSLEKVPVDISKTYLVEAWIKMPTTGALIYAGFAEYDQGGATIAHDPTGANYGYCLASGISTTVGQTWQYFVAEVSGSAAHPSATQFNPGAKFISALVLLNWSGSPQMNVEICGYRISEVAAGHRRAILGLDYINDGATYGRVKATALTGNAIDPSKAGVLMTGSVPPIVPNGRFSYTSTTTSIAITWPSFSLLRPDGTSVTISSGSSTVTGLSANTTYKFYPYVVDSGGTTGTVSFATGGSGSPAIAQLAGGSAAAAAIMYAQGNIPLGGWTGATPSSGGGGGGGGGSACLYPWTTLVLEDGTLRFAAQLQVGDLLPAPDGPARITHVIRRPASRWIALELDGDRGGDGPVVTSDHWFIRASGDRVRAEDLKLGDILKAQGDLRRVTSLALQEDTESVVQIELEEPHLYYLGDRGPLCHNPKP